MGYGSHFFVLQHHLDAAAQIRYQIYVTMVWVSYGIASRKSPGRPSASYKVPTGQWKKWCTKCNLYKPERAHHCRKCGHCVLQMDHHCPWTNNCVGHDNMPHFMRFLVWVVFATSVTLVELLKRAWLYYEDMHLPAYLIRKSELTAVIVLWPLDVFVLLSVAMLLLKCTLHIALGKTQIEVWEYERIESQFHTERLWLKIRNNYALVHGKEMPPLTSWNVNLARYNAMELREIRGEDSDGGLDVSDHESLDPVVPENFTIDDIIFPYDMGLLQNFANALGAPWTWFFPWGSAKGNGTEFPKNDDDDQLNLPWPPDGGNVDFEPRHLTDDELRRLGNVTLIKKHLDARSNMPRSEWTNDTGERLVDYGVDIDAEEEEGLMQEEHRSAEEREFLQG